MELDFSSLAKAIAQLETALSYAESDKAGEDEVLSHLLRAAAIQAFEYTYELSVKLLRRYLEEANATPGLVREMSFNELIRLGYETGLLQAELLTWKHFRQNRGTTSHGYDEDKAQEVYEGIPEFLTEVKFLYNKLTKQPGLDRRS